MNPLLGVDHLSSQRARVKSRSLNNEVIATVITAALGSGATGINFAPESVAVDALRRFRQLSPNSNPGLYPIIPQTRDYVRILAEKGLAGLSRDVLNKVGWAASTRYAIRGGLTLAKSSPVEALELFLDIETTKLRKSFASIGRFQVLLLHELATDLVVALDSRALFEGYLKALNTINLVPGFVTRNLPRFLGFCDVTGASLEDLVVMTPVNPIGFQMAPTAADVERELTRRPEANIIAISTLASGQVELGDAIRYLRRFESVKSITVGVSTVQHAISTFESLRTAFQTSQSSENG